MINFSELLWNPRRRSESRPSSVNIVNGKDAAKSLSRIPVTRIEITPESRIVCVNEPHGPAADRFRLLRMRLRELRSTVNVRSLLVTSPWPKDGKSTVALNLAATLAEGGRNSVLLIDADCHLPSQASTLNLPRKKGFAECLQLGLDPLSVIQRLEPLGLYFLDAGTAEGNASDLLQEEGLERLMEEVSTYFDWVVLDTPPLLALSDAISIGRHVDTSILVTRVGRTAAVAVEEAVKLLGPKQIFGVILNADDGPGTSNALYAGYYRSGYSKGS